MSCQLTPKVRINELTQKNHSCQSVLSDLNPSKENEVVINGDESEDSDEFKEFEELEKTNEELQDEYLMSVMTLESYLNIAKIQE